MKDVDLMDQRVMDRHGGDILLRDGRVSMCGVHQDRRADARGDRLFQRDISDVVTTHEANLNKALSMLHFGVDYQLCPLCVGRERLLTEARLSCGESGEHILLVRRSP
jgi:hypothetical protein